MDNHSHSSERNHLLHQQRLYFHQLPPSSCASFCEPIQGSSTVRVNGQPVIRHGDRFTMNDGNTIGKLVYVEGGDGVANIDGPTTPPDEDEEFFRKIADLAELVGDVADKAQAFDSGTPKRSKTLFEEHVKIDANLGDGIKIEGTEQGLPDTNKTKICIGYTKAVGHGLHGEYHAFVIAENPLTGEKFIASITLVREAHHR